MNCTLIIQRCIVDYRLSQAPKRPHTHKTHTRSGYETAVESRALYVSELSERSLHKYLIISGLLSVPKKHIILLVRITHHEDAARENKRGNGKERRGREGGMKG